MSSLLFPEIARKYKKARDKRIKAVQSLWPDRDKYTSSRTNKTYIPQNQDIYNFINDSMPRYFLLKGGEGGGKSAAGIIKTLNRLRAGMNGIMVSTDLEHFKKSIWPTAKEWIPWGCVIERHQYRQREGWEASKAFTLVFHNEVGGYSELICGGAKEDQIGSWEGPNVNFIHFDEARRHKTPQALKVFDGRARIPGPNEQPPQIYLTTTPRKHWLHEFFGPVVDNDPHADFKRDSMVFTVLTEENISNLDSEFVRQRAQTLSDAEVRILLKAEWHDEGDVEKFVNMIWWDNCKEELPPLTRSDTMVVALDAATGSENHSYLADCFAMIGVTRHPSRPKDTAIRYAGIWIPQAGKLLDYDPIETELKRLCKEFAIVEVTYDGYQLHYMTTQLRKKQVALFN